MSYFSMVQFLVFYVEMKVLFNCMAGGQTALALRVLLAVFSSKISSDINRPFGDEVVGLSSI